MSALDAVRFDAQGLVPVIVTDATSGAVLTLAYANAEALARTRAEGTTWLWSRSRGALWRKGETSGNTQRVVAIDVDCDGDALIYRVEPAGPACHTGAASCFSEAQRFAEADGDDGARFAAALRGLARVVAQRDRERPEGSYTTTLLAGGVDRIGKKIGEEATEVVIAAKNALPAEIAWETSDLLYHLIVLLRERGVALDVVGDELARRAR